MSNPIPKNWPGRYIKILQCAERLAGHDESPADVLDAILSGVVRGDFNGHMKHKRASHPSERPDAYDDCDYWDSANFIEGFLSFGGPNFGKPVFDPPDISREQMAIELAGLSYGEYGEQFRKCYINPISIDERFLIDWWKRQHSATPRLRPSRIHSKKAESDCYHWLYEQMTASPENKPQAKDKYREQALNKFRPLSKRAFDKEWDNSIAATGANWDNPGAPKKSNQS